MQSRTAFAAGILLFLGLSGVSGHAENWNDIADSLLEYARYEIREQGKGRVSLPDVHESWSKRTGFIKIKGEFHATGGFLEDFATLRRVGNATVTREGGVTTMTAVLGLADLRLNYPRYEARVWGAGPDGTIEGRIGKNAVRFVIRFEERGGECVTSLMELAVVEFGDLQVTVGGLGSFDYLAEKMVEWLLEKRRGDVLERVQERLREEMGKALTDFRCEEHVTGLAVPIW